MTVKELEWSDAMRGGRPKPPQQSKAELVAEVRLMLTQRFNEDEAIEYLMGFLTSLDLVGVRDQLRTYATEQSNDRQVHTKT